MAEATYATVSQDYLMATAKMELLLQDTTLDDALLLNFLRQCVKEVRTALSFEQKFCTIEIEDCRGELPCDFVMLNKAGGVFVNPSEEEEDSESPFANSVGGYAFAGNSAFPLGNPNGWNNLIDMTLYQIIGNYIVFNTDADIESVKISYLGVRTDENGCILYPSSHERMLVTYMKARYMEAYFNKYPQALRNEMQASYGRLKRYNKGAENEMTQQDREFVEIYMRRIVN